MGVTGLGEDAQKGNDRTYQGVHKKIFWDGAHYRRDIGAKAL